MARFNLDFDEINEGIGTPDMSLGDWRSPETDEEMRQMKPQDNPVNTILNLIRQFSMGESLSNNTIADYDETDDESPFFPSVAKLIHEELTKKDK